MQNMTVFNYGHATVSGLGNRTAQQGANPTSPQTPFSYGSFITPLRHLCCVPLCCLKWPVPE